MLQDGGMTLENRTATMGLWRWVLWLFCLAIWTVALLRPEPARVNRAIVEHYTDLPVSKFVHVGVYAGLTALASILPMARRRWLLLVFLSFHAMITEYLQNYVPEREGSWRDVGLNHLGIAVGLAISWYWWMRKRPPM
jgi:VanZ family protein